MIIETSLMGTAEVPNCGIVEFGASGLFDAFTLFLRF